MIIFSLIGYITPDDLRIAFNKIQVKLSNEELDSMFRFFNISNLSKISVKDFAQNFAGSTLRLWIERFIKSQLIFIFDLI